MNIFNQPNRCNSCRKIIGPRARYCHSCHVTVQRRSRRVRELTKDYSGVEFINWEELAPALEKTEWFVLSKLMDIIQDYYSLTYSQLKAKCRAHYIAAARFHFYWFVNSLRRRNLWMRVTNRQCSGFLGQSHTEFWHGIKTVDNDLSIDKMFREKHRELQELIIQRIYKKID